MFYVFFGIVLCYFGFFFLVEVFGYSSLNWIVFEIICFGWVGIFGKFYGDLRVGFGVFFCFNKLIEKY